MYKCRAIDIVSSNRLYEVILEKEGAEEGVKEVWVSHCQMLNFG